MLVIPNEHAFGSDEATMTQTNPPLTTVIVEDSAVLQDLLSGMLASIPGIELCGHANREETALALLREIRPRLAIIDLELLSGSGLNVLGAVAEAPEDFGQPRVLVFSNHAHEAVRSRCLKLGAEAFFDKSLEMEELLDHVQRIAAGGA